MQLTSILWYASGDVPGSITGIFSLPLWLIRSLILGFVVVEISFLVRALQRGGSAENLLPVDSYFRSSISIILAASSIMVPEARAASSEKGVVISCEALFHSRESRRMNGTGSSEWVLIATGV
jgi:hypothetical protein